MRLFGRETEPRAYMPSDVTPIEIRANRFFMGVSLGLIALAVASFLWLAGILEWRGTTADTKISLSLECKDATALTEKIEVVLDLDEEEEGTSSIVLWLSDDDDAFRSSCQRIELDTSRQPLRLLEAGTADAPTDKGILVEGSAGLGAGELPLYQNRKGFLDPTYVAKISAVPRLKFSFRRDELMRFVGLSEREVRFAFGVSVRSVDNPARYYRKLGLAFRPPENYSVVSSDTPLKLENHRYWSTDELLDSGPYSISIKNPGLSRLDHILDSSISAILGTGMGAFLASWLTLRIRRSSMH